ncbi:MAG: hypothetical protein U9Q06_04555 [Nanoarchaeota archaeon]|nr:hypothetical protein [Nanoarchaeota archaeon]
MEIEKKRNSFIGLEWKKLVLPIILVIFFSYQIFVFYSVSNVMENYSCDANEFLQKVETFRQQNNTEELNKTILEWKPKAEKFKEDLEKSIGSETIFSISSTINPFFPFPCELSPKNYCRYYISKKSFDCMFDVDFNSGLGSLFAVSKPEYKKVSIFLLIFHLAIIFTIGYLISAIILLIFRNVKTKRNSNPPTPHDSKSF